MTLSTFSVIFNWVFPESLRVGFGFSTISLRNNIFSTKQHDSLRFLYETTFSLRNNIFSTKQHVLSETTFSLAKQHFLYETIFSTKQHNKYQYNLIYHLASSTEKEVFKVVFKVPKEVSKVSECFKKNIVVSKRTLLFPKEHCCYEKLFVADFCVSFTQAVLETPKYSSTDFGVDSVFFVAMASSASAASAGASMISKYISQVRAELQRQRPEAREAWLKAEMDTLQLGSSHEGKPSAREVYASI